METRFQTPRDRPLPSLVVVFTGSEGREPLGDDPCLPPDMGCKREHRHCVDSMEPLSKTNVLVSLPCYESEPIPLGRLGVLFRSGLGRSRVRTNRSGKVSKRNEILRILPSEFVTCFPSPPSTPVTET